VHAALHAAGGHRGHRGQAQEDRSGRPQALDREGVVSGDEVAERGGSGCHGQTLDAIAVLGGERDAVERADRFAAGATPVALPRVRERARIEDGDAVQADSGAVVRRDAVEIAGDELDTGDVAGVEGGAQSVDVGFDDGEGLGGHGENLHRLFYGGEREFPAPSARAARGKRYRFRVRA
jgi:hypothetical protein